jgi:hypothetical protein
MEKNIEDLTVPEMIGIIGGLQDSYVENPQILRDEEAYPTENLVDLLTILFYLERTEEVPEARSLFSGLYKDLENEIAVRLGDIPYI